MTTSSTSTPAAVPTLADGTPDLVAIEDQVAAAVTEAILTMRDQHGITLDAAVDAVAQSWHDRALADGQPAEVAVAARDYIGRVGEAVRASYARQQQPQPPAVPFTAPEARSIAANVRRMTETELTEVSLRADRVLHGQHASSHHQRARRVRETVRAELLHRDATRSAAGTH